MNNPLVSIVMPFKNTASFLDECFSSIRNQSYINWELLAVNDHSTDDSLEIANRYAQQDERIQIFTNDGAGIIAALQKAYQKSSGDFITRMDSDDLMTQNKLSVMVKQLLQSGKGNIAHGLVKYFSEDELGDGFRKYETWLNGLSKEGTNFNEIYKECVIVSPCWMVYRSDFDECSGFNSTIYPEDYDLAFRFYAAGLKCIPSQDVLHHWRDYSTRTSRTHKHYAFNVFLDIKVYYFLKLNYNSEKNLVVWGAGKKGKLVAELLMKNNIPFSWICDNPKKIGKTIYDKELQSFTDLAHIENSQSIITVANPEAQKEIEKFFIERNKLPMKDYFFFC